MDLMQKAFSVVRTALTPSAFSPPSNTSFCLPPPPAGSPQSRSYKPLSAPTCNLHLEPVGRHFQARVRRRIRNRTVSEDHAYETALDASKQQEEDEAARLAFEELEEEEPETPQLLASDPKQWKTQDHYAVLGLSSLRWRATHAQIRAAHRRKVLKHHPDKKAASVGGTQKEGMDNFFKCITKALEVLSDPERRRQFDSVDPAVDDSLPKILPKNETDFFETYAPIFERESRFSKKQPVPALGTIDSTRQEMDKFYTFWYDFDSWRSFEYLDKEDTEVAESRDEKRYLIGKNKAERSRRKKEDNARLRKLVDQVRAADPRIKKLRDDEKALKDAKKREKEQATRMKEEELRLADEDRKAVERKADELAKQQALDSKKLREAQKKAVKKEKKLSKSLINDRKYLEKARPDAVGSVEIMGMLEVEVELLLDNLDLNELEELRKKLENDTAGCLEEEAVRLIAQGAVGLDGFAQLVSDAARREVTKENRNTNAPSTASTVNSAKMDDKSAPWTADEIQVLIKAANRFPGGTVDRWAVISDYVSQHSGQRPRSQQELIRKSKSVQKGATGLESDALRQLQNQRKHDDYKRIDDSPTMDYDSMVTSAPPIAPAASLKKAPLGKVPDRKPDVATASQPPPTQPLPKRKASVTTPENESSAPKSGNTLSVASKPVNAASKWTPKEQQELECALQAYPPSWKGEGDRWDKIAEQVQGRNKKEVKQRVKWIMEQVKAKK